MFAPTPISPYRAEVRDDIPDVMTHAFNVRFSNRADAVSYAARYHVWDRQATWSRPPPPVWRWVRSAEMRDRCCIRRRAARRQPAVRVAS